MTGLENKLLHETIILTTVELNDWMILQINELLKSFSTGENEAVAIIDTERTHEIDFTREGLDKIVNPKRAVTPEHSTAIFEALGEASMSWKPIPSGVFDDTRAKRVGEELIEKLES